MPRKRTADEIVQRKADGEMLHELAFARGLSIGDIARNLGVAESTVYAIHRGESWNPGTIRNYRELVGMTGSGPAEAPEDVVVEYAVQWFRSLPWDVRAHLMVTGRYLTDNFTNIDERQAEMTRLAERMRSTSPNG